MSEYSAEIVEIGNQIAALSPSKAGDLLAYMKERYNIVPIGIPQFKQPDKQEEKKPETQAKTEWSVFIINYDPSNKVGLVKLYREISGRGLKESMDAIVATASGTALAVKENVSKEEAEKVKAQLEAASAKVELR